MKVGRCGSIHLTSPAEIGHLISLQERLGCGFRAPLYRAAMAGEMHLVEVPPGGVVPPPFLAARTAPRVVVLGDDGGGFGGDDPGPAGFVGLRRIFAWASHVMLHATGGQVAHYQIVADTAIAMRARVLLIETGSARAAAWGVLVNAEQRRRLRRRRAPLATLNILPASGASHPAVSA